VTPIRDIALCIELRERPIHALMTRDDWSVEIDRYLDTPVAAVAGSATPDQENDNG
jgi:hypothetical protein